jgi:hypothetical protein
MEQGKATFYTSPLEALTTPWLKVIFDVDTHTAREMNGQPSILRQESCQGSANFTTAL